MTYCELCIKLSSCVPEKKTCTHIGENKPCMQQIFLYYSWKFLNIQICINRSGSQISHTYSLLSVVLVILVTPDELLAVVLVILVTPEMLLSPLRLVFLDFLLSLLLVPAKDAGPFLVGTTV